jgi:hypothetical protein
VKEAAEVAVAAALDALMLAQHVLTVRFVLFDSATCNAYLRAAESLPRVRPNCPILIEKSPS